MLFDPVSLAVGAALIVSGYGAGRFHRPRKQPDQPTATCGCGHTLAHHDTNVAPVRGASTDGAVVLAFPPAHGQRVMAPR